eukprot:SAG31_NODE_6627_length_1945_cov_5.098592_3_plen_102_part_00
MAAVTGSAAQASGFGNPLAASDSSFDDSSPARRGGIFNDIEQALSDGSLSPAQAIVAIEGRLSLQQGRVDALEAKLSREGGGLDTAISSTLARLAEAPMNW